MRVRVLGMMEETAAKRRGLFNILVLSAAFAILFAAYNALQNLITSLFPPGLGNQSLGILYGSVAVTVFLGPPMVEALGTRLTMFIGALGYVAYMASLIHFIPAVVLVMSTVIGFGAAVLWVAAGEFIKDNCTSETRGFANGLFWTVFQTNNIAGNLGTYLVLSHLNSTSTLYVLFTAVGALGTALILFLRPSAYATAAVENHWLQPSRSDKAGGGASSVASVLRKAGSSALAAMRIVFTRESLLLAPLYALTGIELSFWTGEFTQLLPTDVIGLVLTMAGVGELFGTVWGVLADRVGRTFVQAAGTVIYATGMALACWIKSAGGANNDSLTPQLGGAPLAAYAAALCFGLGDAAFNNNAFAIVAAVYSDRQGSDDSEEGGDAEDGAAHLLDDSEDGEAAVPKARGGGGQSVAGFTFFQLAQNLGSCCWFFIALALPMHDAPGVPGTYWQVYIQAGLLALSLVTFWVVDREDVMHKAAGKAALAA